MSPEERAVSVRGFAKSFGGTRILSDISLDVASGTVHALVGAGKSSFGKIIGGYNTPGEGQVSIFDKVVARFSPREALGVGVAMIHQELQLAPELSVVQNVFLGRESNRSGVLVKGDLERFACCRPLRCWQTGDEDGLNRLRIFLPSGVVDRLYTG